MGSHVQRSRLFCAAATTAFLLLGCGGSGEAPVANTLAQVTVVSGTATFSGNRSNYTITKTSTGYTVTDNVGTDGSNPLVNVQIFKFLDVSINLGIGDKSDALAAADLKSLTELYVAFFNRVPDADGLSYWIGQFKAGLTLIQISESFYRAAVQFSALTGYSATMSNADFITIVYKNVLGRSTPDQSGLDYWSNALAKGTETHGSLVSTILASAHTFKGDATYGYVANLLDNKVTVANYFAVQQGLNYNTSDESISKGMAIAAAVTSTGTTAATNLIGITDTLFNLAPPFKVSGTAANGKPIGGATLTLKDSAGANRTAATASDGTFSLNAAGLVAPFMLQITTAAGTKLYSVSADANAKTTINITPLTDLIIRSWYGVQGVSVDTAFASPTASPAPSPTAVQTITAAIQNMAQLWLNQAGVSTSNFSLISTPFSANGSGVDLVLEQTKVNVGTGQVIIASGSTTQTSNLTYSGGAINLSTTTTGANGNSSSNSTTAVPVQTSQQTALSAINTLLGNFANTINAGGAALQANALLPSLDPNLLQWGLNQSQFAGFWTAQFAGQTLSIKVQQIKSLSTTNADLVLQIFTSKNGQTGYLTHEFFFKVVNGAWLMSGDNAIAEIDLGAVVCCGPPSAGGAAQIIVDVFAPQGTVTGATVIGGGIWNTATGVAQKAIAVNPYGNQDHWNGSGTPVPTAGTPFTLSLTPAGGPAVSYTVKSNAVTNEWIQFTNFSQTNSLANVIGRPLTANWTLPATFPVANIQFKVNAYTGPQNSPATLDCEVQGSVGTGGTTGSITIPTTCGGKTVTNASLAVTVTGVNGEDTEAVVNF